MIFDKSSRGTFGDDTWSLIQFATIIVTDSDAMDSDEKERNSQVHCGVFELVRQVHVERDMMCALKDRRRASETFTELNCCTSQLS